MQNNNRIRDFTFLENLVENKKYSVIDIRSPEDYRYGTVLEAPNAPLRAFLPTLTNALKETKKIVLIASESDSDTLNACIRYATQLGGVDLSLSYFFYEDAPSD